MPFTLSHAVLAPPLAKLSGNRLPIAALAIGTMTPDLYRLFTDANYNQSHQWSGLIFPNLFIALCFCVLWYGLYRQMLLSFFRLYKPLNLKNLNQFSGFIISLLCAIVIGIATHLIWDGLTHVDFRTFAFQHQLSQPIHFFQYSYPLHRVLQIGTSILALPLLFWMFYRYYQHNQHPQVIPHNLKVYVLTLFFLCLGVGMLSFFYFATSLYVDALKNDLYRYIGKSINYFFRAFLSLFTLGSFIFVLLKWKTSIFNHS